MKKVLMISYYFPPAEGVGTFRITKFVKYLPFFYWEPLVLTVKKSFYKNKDESLLSDISQKTKIFRTGITKIPVNDVGLKWSFSLIRFMKKIIEREKINIIYFTGGPFLQLRIAPIIKRKYNIPYVIDFRDPWLLSPYKKKQIGPKKIIGEFLSKRWELLAIKNAARVIFATKEMKELYSSKYTSFKKKFLTIENGYDPSDYKDILAKKFNKFSIIYTGKFSKYRNPIFFLDALQELKNTIDFRFIHVGGKEPLLKKLIIERKLQKKVVFTGLLSYKEAISYAKGAKILLLITGGHKIESTQKVFDYIACNKPIIAIAKKDSAVARILSHFKNTFIIKNDPETIKNTIIKIYKEKINNLEVKDNNILNKYHRKNLTKKLAEIFDDIIS